MIVRYTPEQTWSDSMRIRNLLGGSVIAVGLSVFTLAGTAFAHHPTYVEDCNHIKASGTDYPAGSHVTLTVDGKKLLDKTFDGEGFSIDHPWDPSVSHPYALVVTSPDHIGEVNWSGTQKACVAPTTTTAPPVATTPAPPATSAPTPTTAAPVPTTATAPPTTVASASPVMTEQAPVTTAKPIALPATGSSSTPVLMVGLAALLAGGVLTIAGRRGSVA